MPAADIVNVVALIVAGSIDSLNLTVMLTFAGAEVVVGNVDSTVGGTASIMPVIGVTATFGTVPSVAATSTLAVLATGPAAAPLKITLKVQVPPATTGPVKQLTSATWKSAAFAPRAVIVAIVRVLVELRFATVTGIGVDINGAGRCAGKAMVVGVIDIPITLPSRVNRFVVPLIGPATVKEVTGVPVTVTSAMESPT
jgi:hypothetical protein